MHRGFEAVIPAYQCARTIGGVVSGALREVGSVVVVDDGSSDGTATHAIAAGARLVRHDFNRGKGEALRSGLRAALDAAATRGLEGVVLLDGDGQHDPAEIPQLIEARRAQAAEMVIGSRWADPSLIPGARYWTNYIGSKVLSRMSGVDLEDSQSGFRLLTLELASRLSLRSRGYAIESEMLLKAARLGARIINVPITAIYDPACGSHYRPVLDTVRISCAAIYTKVFDDA